MDSNQFPKVFDNVRFRFILTVKDQLQYLVHFIPPNELMKSQHGQNQVFLPVPLSLFFLPLRQMKVMVRTKPNRLPPPMLLGRLPLIWEFSSNTVL